LATPGTASSRARIVQYADIDIWIKEWFLEVMPIWIARPVAETGASITGGAAQVGRVALTAVIRSWTSWRARNSSTSGSKMSSIADNWGTDFDRMSSRPSTPLNACSKGTVTSDSTSEVDRPRQAVWMTTRGGANSGNASALADGNVAMPIAISSAPAATTSRR
jgi:hypothetical protein